MRLDVLDESEFFFEHANIRRKDTGQPFDIWIDEKGCERNVQHNEPRFKFSANGIELDIILHNDDKIEIVNNSKEIKKFKHSKEAVNFVQTFKQPLRMHWNHDLTTYELIKVLRDVYKNDTAILDAISKALKDTI